LAGSFLQLWFSEQGNSKWFMTVTHLLQFHCVVIIISFIGTIIYESANMQAQLILSFLNTMNILSWTVTQ